MQSLKSKQKFLSLEELKQQVVLECKERVLGPLIVIGFIKPGHGLSGKKRWLTSDQELGDMYEMFKGKRDVTIWCYGPSPSEPTQASKRQQTTETTESESARKTSRYDKHVDKMAGTSGGTSSQAVSSNCLIPGVAGRGPVFVRVSL